MTSAFHFNYHTLTRLAVHTYDYHFINGEEHKPSSDSTFQLLSPRDESPLGIVPFASEADVDAAVAAARRAFDEGPFPRFSPTERGDVIRRLSAAIQARGEDIAQVISEENGCPIQGSLGSQVFAATMVLDSYAAIADNHEFSADRAGTFGQRVTVHQHPVGVCAAIIPWNLPLYIMAMKLGPALAAGCTVVIKPAPDTALDPYLLAEAIKEAEVPEGVINIVMADRAESEYLVKHPGVDKVSLTGSSATGRRVGALCGEQLKRCTLELGGKSAAILLDDFDLALAPNLINAGVFNNGQACAAQTRFLVPRSRYEEITTALAETLGAMNFGDPLDAETQIGPLVNRNQRDRALGLMRRAVADGARALCGGPQGAMPDKGWYVPPTLFADVHNDMEIAREEVFAPVLCAVAYDDEADAIRLANDSIYGLGGGVWSEDHEKAAAIAAQIRTGAITINHDMLLDFNSPFGGFKQSGIGRELGAEGLSHYTELQSVLYPIG